MTERFDVFRYEITRPDAAPESRYSFAPMQGTRYAGRGEPSDAHPMGNEAADTSDSAPAGHVEVPDGTSIATLDPPVLDIPGRGRVDLSAVIGVTEGDAGELGHLVHWRPAG